jgi:gas vesicle protein
MKSFRYISSFLVGFAVGAGVALMVAPMTGKKMQRKVIDRVDDLKVAARRMAS